MSTSHLITPAYQDRFQFSRETKPSHNQPLLVSIIVNNYNYDQFLNQSIDSALNQTYPHTEVIVVDDGSTDGSNLIIRNYADRVKPVFKINGGQASALNLGFFHSTGQIVIFLDADDYLFPNTVEQVVSVWQPNIAKVQYRLQVVDIAGKSIGFHPPIQRQMRNGEVLNDLLNQGCYNTPVTSGNAFNSVILEKVLPIPESDFQLAADGYLVNLVPFYGQIISINDPLGAYRMHDKNLWASSNDIDIKKLHMYIQHDLQRYNIISINAKRFGYKLSSEFPFLDYLHLQFRITSLRLDSKKHPIKLDSLFYLMKQGIWTTVKCKNLNLRNKILLLFWFVYIGLMPSFMVKPFVKSIIFSHC
jgi:glycosyltransferase involved in cell wall biosynthesis